MARLKEMYQSEISRRYDQKNFGYKNIMESAEAGQDCINWALARQKKMLKFWTLL